MTKHGPTLVIWNPSAGSADRAIEVKHALQALPQTTICQPRGRDAAIQEAIRQARQGARLVIAAGGDGTVNAVAEGLARADTGAALGIIPLGTGNDLARTLEIPPNPQDALEVLQSGVPQRLDLVEVTSSSETRHCSNMITGGNTGRYLQHMTDELKQQWGPLCYLRGVIDVVSDLQVYRIEVCCDGGPPETFDALNVFIANGRCSGGGLAVSPQARLDDGQVDVVIVCDGDAGDIASLTTEYVVGDYLSHELVAFRRARQVRITSDPPMPLTSDGDEIGTTPITAVVNAGSLSVLAPGPQNGPLDC